MEKDELRGIRRKGVTYVRLDDLADLLEWSADEFSNADASVVLREIRSIILEQFATAVGRKVWF